MASMIKAVSVIALVATLSGCLFPPPGGGGGGGGGPRGGFTQQGR